MFVIYYLWSWLTYKCKRKNEGLLVFGIVAVVACYLSCQVDDGGTVYNAFSLSKLFAYLQFFVFGLLCRKHYNLLERAINNKYIMAVIIIMWFAAVYFASIDFGASMTSTAFQYSFKLLAGYLGIIVLVSFFALNQKFFSKNTVKGRSLQYIGRRTLDIYLLHSFLIPTVPYIGAFFESSPNVILEIVLVFGLSLLVVAFSILVSNIIRLSPFLEHWLFGGKVNR